MNLLVSLNNKELDDYLNYTNSFIIGLKDFSVNYLDFSIEEIKKILEKYPNIELFISINKNIFNKDLSRLEDELDSLSKLNVKGVLFYDLAVLSIVKRKKLPLNLVWHQGHMVTNYNTCEYYRNKGCTYAYLASEITTSEIMEIKNKSKIKLMAFLFGYPIVSFSKRKLLSNYFNYNKQEMTSDWSKITTTDNNEYFIKESKLGTSIIYGKVLNGIRPFYELKDTLDYAILDEQMVDHDLFINVLKIYKDVLDNKVDYLLKEKEIYSLTGSMDTLFYYKKTIYRVKDENKN